MAAHLLFDVNFGRRQRKQRVYRHFSHELNVDECRQRYRFSQESVRYITNLIEPQLCRPTMRSYSLSSISQVEMALRYYATEDNMKTNGDTLGFHKSSVSRSIRDVSQALVDISPNFIKWPSRDQKVDIKRGFYTRISCCWLYPCKDNCSIGIRIDVCKSEGVSLHQHSSNKWSRR